MNKNILLVALLTSGLIAQAQDLRPEPTATANERVTVADFGDRTEITKYYSNGQIKERGYYRDGQRHGSYVLYTEDGVAVVQGQYVHGKKVGLWMTTAADQSQQYLILYGANGQVTTKFLAVK